MNKTLIELQYSIFGHHSLGEILGMGFFMTIGITLSIAIHYLIMGKKNKDSPVNFSPLFWIKDNTARFIALIIIAYLSIRFSNELFGNPLTEIRAVFYGLTIDKTLESFVNYFKKSKAPVIDFKMDNNNNDSK